jgi:dihydroxyacetone kinase-like protein
MAERFANRDGRIIVERLIETVRLHKAYLSEIDGAIGDGDHGVNMAKGFSLTAERLTAAMDLAEALKTLGRTLVTEIGGAMGPLYGSLFKALAKACQGRESIDAPLFAEMLKAGLAAVVELGQAKTGDKTLVDTLEPAVRGYSAALAGGSSFRECLRRMEEEAARGKESTREMTAKVGRASRLGERSRGSLDAGAASCHLILKSMAETIGARLL